MASWHLAVTQAIRVPWHSSMRFFASLCAPARICFFPRMPDHADEAPALEAEARLFTRYLVGRPPPAELVDRYRAANAEVLAIDGGTP